MNISTGYKPQPKQVILHQCKANEILYGGSAGPGKSHALRHDALDWCLRIPGLQVYLFRRTFPELEKNHILPSRSEFPKSVGDYKNQQRRWEFKNGSMLHFCHCQYENDVFNYQGAEIHLLVIDELTTFTEFQYDYLRGRLRCTIDIPEKAKVRIPGILAASNPGGIGHEFAKRRWVDYCEPYVPKQATGREGGMVRAYIPGLLEDNLILMEKDPEYIHRLDALPEPYRTAYKYGKWDIFMGQAFEFNTDNHVIDPIQVPAHMQVYMSFDWGFGAPFSVLWSWIDGDGRILVFSEWYGWNGEPNKGLRLTDSEIARGIKEREIKLGIDNRTILRLAGHDCFNAKPDYKGGGQGKPTSEVFSEHGVFLTKADSTRHLKIRQFRERLKCHAGNPPMLVVYRDCEQFRRTIPLIQTDDRNVEEINQKGEDHVFDCIAQVCMARPIISHAPVKQLNRVQQHIRDLEQGNLREDYESDAYEDWDDTYGDDETYNMTGTTQTILD